MHIRSAPDLPVDDLSSLSCNACGLYDATLRQSAHPSVVSVGVSRESARVGIFCARCRGIAAAKAAAISLLAGWWSLRGPKLTIAAVRDNLGGGKQSASSNARLLRATALFEYERGNPEIAATFVAAAHAVQPQRENSRLMDELRRGGHRATASESPWRYAPWAPVVVIALLLSGVVVKTAMGLASREDVEVAAQASAVLPKPKAKPPIAQMARDNEVVDLSGSADVLEKRLASKPSPQLAQAYFNARMVEAKSQIAPRVKRGDDLVQIRMSILDLGRQPQVAQLLKEKSGLKGAYDELCLLMNDVTLYYRGGAPVEAIERTAGESMNTTVYIALHALVADMRGQQQRRDALASQVDIRAQSIDEMRMELRLRGAVISLTTAAIEKCLSVY